MEWQPIETAPKNELILVYSQNEGYDIAEFCYGKWRAIGYAEESSNERILYGYMITHWMPLPEPPK